MRFKLDKNKSKKIIALALVTTITSSSLSGCKNNEKDNLLAGTILERARVISFEDGHIDIVKISENHIFIPQHKHNHYKSIITNEVFTTTECNATVIEHKYEIKNDESIIIYLTSEEISKFAANEATNEDVKNIILRIFIENEELKISPKTKTLN
jgi:hypothetical protein